MLSSIHPVPMILSFGPIVESLLSFNDDKRERRSHSHSHTADTASLWRLVPAPSHTYVRTYLQRARWCLPLLDRGGRWRIGCLYMLQHTGPHHADGPPFFILLR